ncbi:MAG: rRNA maturation RNase YbeY [Boseongicola sp.]|nr:rRNA maturation RNase YbeY [Boseongicola sp.]NNJ67726.1 rRNA maturation RNase YbeY [Boseongicola sp.]
MSADVIIEDDRWAAVELDALAERAVSATLGHLGLVADDWDIAVLAADDARISVLNEGFRGKAQATNVLSWPSAERGAAQEGARPDLPEGDPELGDLALAYETCAREAEMGGIAFRDHVTHLIVHGTLHLLGYDHVRDGDGDLMEAVEIVILKELGIADPYSGVGFGDVGKD